MIAEEFGTINAYRNAFATVLKKGIAKKQEEMLREHLAAPSQTITWRRLAEKVGYPNGNTVNLQYGCLAELVARELGLKQKPLDTSKQERWLWTLVYWADERDAITGHTAFVLRPEVVAALSELFPEIETEQQYERHLAAANRDAEGLSNDMLNERLARAQKIPGKIQVVSTKYERNPDVIVAVLRRANGICEHGGKEAPFLRASDNTPYLETPHRTPLSLGGYDSIENAIALCPNCHRKQHHGYTNGEPVAEFH